jgi:hypothetical protein
MFGRRGLSTFAAVLAAVSLAAAPGCDWLKASDSGARQSPFLNSLAVRPSSVLCGQTFTVSFRYEDQQGDIARARVTLQREGDSAVREETPPWPETLSRSSGTAAFDFSFACDSAGGVWSVKVQVEDEAGHTSNILSSDIRLNAAG